VRQDEGGGKGEVWGGKERGAEEEEKVRSKLGGGEGGRRRVGGMKVKGR